MHGGAVVEDEPRVLIVDDDCGLLKSFERLGEASEYVAIGKPSGAEGLQALETSKVDVLLVDVAMPEMGGEKFLQTAKERGLLDRVRAVRVITGKGRGTDEAKRLAKAGYVVLEKGYIDPSGIEELLANPRADVGTHPSSETLVTRVKKEVVKREFAKLEDSVSKIVESDVTRSATDQNAVKDVEEGIGRLKEGIEDLSANGKRRGGEGASRLSPDTVVFGVTIWSLIVLATAITALGVIANMSMTVCAVIGIISLGQVAFLALVARAEERGRWWAAVALYGAAASLLYELGVLLELVIGGRPS